MSNPLNFEREIELLKESNQLRYFRTLQLENDGYVIFKGKRILNFSSNDYLGLLSNASLKQSFEKEQKHHPEWQSYSSCSSRLLSGNTEPYNLVEAELEKIYNRPTLFFNSGYHANLGILPALTSKNDLIVSDKLVHASLIDGIRLSEANHIRYRHNDYQQLKNILSEKRHLYEKVFIVTESIFSMDGDLADLRQLINIKNQFDAVLYLDEAHAVGVRGENGLGLAEEVGCLNDIDILIGTMGKALCSVGAYAVCDESVKQWLINKARPLIFSTALPPINLAWSLHVFKNLSSFAKQREALQLLTSKLADEFKSNGIEVQPLSHILPIMIGDNETTVQLSSHLQKEGFLVMPIRPPTVPVGTSRLRLSLSSAIKWDDLKKLPGIIHLFLKDK